MKLLLGRAGQGLTKALSFLPGLKGVLAKLSELVGQLHDDECDHGYRPVFSRRRSI